jgi:RecB family exonuclease
VITPRTTRLLRVPDLQALHETLARLAIEPVRAGGGPGDTRSRAILVPTRGAAEELRRTLEHRMLAEGRRALLLPDLLTRADLYDRMQERIPGLPARLSGFDREVIFRRAARETAAAGVEAPFTLRAGLIVELLGFYDELRRRDRTLDAFERLMTEALEPSAEADRGAARLLMLTRFLAAAFRAFELRTRASGGIDEHSLRAALLALDPGAPPAYRHVIVTVADQAADPRGLWMADFDLLARLPALERLDIVVTEHVLASGFHERLHDALPGIDEERHGSPAPMPVLAAPATGLDDEPTWSYVCRDREEELVAAARAVKAAERPPSRTALVFQRPLPYLYLARRVFPDGRVPYQALDALPLAAEPFAAALDLVFTCLLADGNRASIVELLASPHWRFTSAGATLTVADVRAADALLRERKYLGGWDRLAALAAQANDERAGVPAGGRHAQWSRAQPALAAAHAVAQELAPLGEGASASAQVDALLAFIAAHERLPAPDAPWRARHLRARQAIMAALWSLRDAHARHDDTPLPLVDLAGTVRRWIEGQTFSPRTGTSGIRLLDAPAAAYADADAVRLLGLVESDWPERPPRNIFYPAWLLAPLGWPKESERLAGARARFRDLLQLPRRRLSASTFTLEDDAIVTPSSLLEELPAAGLPVERTAPRPAVRMFLHEALSMEPVVSDPLGDEPAGWLALRRSRTVVPGASGLAGDRPPGVYAVSHVERYLECPFKYFAAHVLKLREERDDESTLTPQERGQLLHEVFETFFREWQAGGRGAITTANVAEATALFTRVTGERLASLPEADRALEQTHLLGSAAAPGLAERAFAFEIEQGGEVLERLLEHDLEGEFEFRAGERARRVGLRIKADRIDLLGDGTLRVIDYKLGRAPKPGRALQLPVYGVCAEQSLAGRRGRRWTLGRAGYVAFREKQPFTALGASSSLAEAVAEGQARFLDTLEAIERGEFPVNPDEPFLCTRCGYAVDPRHNVVLEASAGTGKTTVLVSAT